MAMASSAPGMFSHGGARTPRSTSKGFGSPVKNNTLREATIPAINPVANGIGPRVEELETVINYQIKASKEESESLIKTIASSQDVDSKLEALKAACAEHLEAKREEMRRRTAHHKAESERMQKQISRLKDEHCDHQQALLALQRRMAELEQFIGE
jgi:SMC interacting uncharacterized protein involved in chromosome segregation